MPMANKKVARVFEVGRIKRSADPALLGGSVARENQRRIGIAVLLDAGRLVMPVYSSSRTSRFLDNPIKFKTYSSPLSLGG